ncbi:MAG: NAD(P)-dependent oxidoreductase, partial [Pseudomonadota bacterium]
MTKPHIGFIGLGLMGGAMVSRLQDQGYECTLLGNRDRTELDKALARGATEAKSAKELTQASDVVMICVGTSDQVESRMRGADGVIAGLSAGKTVIDFGTSLPASTKALGAEVAATGATYLDAPIGRTPSHARDGMLNLMCAGDKAAWESVKPVLDDLGENVFHLGDLGNGHAIKLINNFVAQSMANLFAEAFVTADNAGVSRQSVYDVISAGPVGNGFFDFMKAYAVDGDPTKLAFSIKNA